MSDSSSRCRKHLPEVRAANDRLIPGQIGYDHSMWWLTWSPRVPLPSGVELQVTVAVPGATDWIGNDLTDAALFAFRTVNDNEGP